MDGIDVYSLTKVDMEEQADIVKLSILKALVKDGIVDFDVADEWCQTHGVILSKKTMFRTLSDLWKKQEKSEGHYYSIVSLK